MDELVEWLRGVLADDEAVAKAAAQTSGHEAWGSFGNPEDDIASVGAAHPDHPDGEEWYLLGGNLLRQSGSRPLVEHVARHDPAQVLADIEAKKTVLDLHDHSGVRWTGFPRADRQESYCVHDQQAAPCPTVLALASAYRNRPGWKPEWEA